MAVVGLGGLGHMAVKLAHAMGATVTVLSQSLKKQEDGLRLGADHYHATSDENTFTDLAGSLDLIVNAAGAAIDINAYLQLLKLDGALVNVGTPAEPLPVQAFSVISGRRSFAGSMIGGIRETQEMLDFCTGHGIGAEIEVVPDSKINDAYERVLASDLRYRFAPRGVRHGQSARGVMLQKKPHHTRRASESVPHEVPPLKPFQGDGGCTFTFN